MGSYLVMPKYFFRGNGFVEFTLVLVKFTLYTYSSFRGHDH